MEQAEQIRFSGDRRHSWKEAVLAWAGSVAIDLSPATFKRYRVSLKQLRHLPIDERGRTLGSLYVDEVVRKTVASLVRARKKARVTNATLRRDLTALSSVLGYCQEQEWVETNAARDFNRRSIKERRDPIALPSVEDIDFALPLAPGNFRKLCRLAQYTGMREEECAGLERRQIDHRERAITLLRTKTNRPRTVPLDERAYGTLTGTVPHIASVHQFCHHEGARYANVASRFGAIMRRAVALAKRQKRDFRRFRFHDLRHWFAVDYLRQGGSIYDLQKILGHGTIKTTEIYLRYLTPQQQRITKYGENEGTK